MTRIYHARPSPLYSPIYLCIYLFSIFPFPFRQRLRELPGERRREGAAARRWEVEADTWMVGMYVYICIDRYECIYFYVCIYVYVYMYYVRFV